MKVSNAGTFSKTKRVGPRVVASEVFQLHVLSDENLEIGTFTSLDLDGKTFYFKVVTKEAEGQKLRLALETAGYWARNLTRTIPNIDPRKLVDLELTVITDGQLVLQLQEESRWT